MAENPDNQSFLFIADLHAITQIKNGDVLRQNNYSTAAAWLACGLNIEKVIFYRQSKVLLKLIYFVVDFCNHNVGRIEKYAFLLFVVIDDDVKA